MPKQALMDATIVRRKPLCFSNQSGGSSHPDFTHSTGQTIDICFAIGNDYFFHRFEQMPATIPVSLNVQTAEVLDTRTVGTSNDTNSIQFKAAGLLRYETDNDEWKYYNGTSFVPFSGLPTRTNIPLTSDDMTKVLMEGHLNGGVGDTGALWQQLSLNHLSDMEFISAISMYRTSYGLIVKGNVQTEDTNGVTNFTLTPTGDVICNDINCSDMISSRAFSDTLTITTNSSNPSATKLKLTEYGEILAGGSSQDSGTDGSVLISKGTGNPVEWRPRVIATAYLTNNIYVPRAAMTDMKPLTVDMDLGTSGSYGYTTSTGIYAIPRDGIYRVVYQVGFLDNDGYGPHGMNACSVELLKNTGGGFTREYNSTSKSSNEYEDNRLMANLSAVMDFSQGDELLCRASYFSGNSNTVMVGGNSPRYCFQSIELIG
jgi:hypothetical protein